MKFFDHKNIWKIAVVLILLSMILPSKTNIISRVGQPIIKQYHFGVFTPFLTLQASDDLNRYKNIFYIAVHTEKVSFDIAGCIISLIFCYVVAYILLKVWQMLYKRLKR